MYVHGNDLEELYKIIPREILPKGKFFDNTFDKNKLQMLEGFDTANFN